jgi:ABC-type glutathione transport system ATPase component
MSGQEQRRLQEDPSTVIEAQNLGKSYESHPRDGSDSRWALRAVNLVIREGETVGIVGESGSGKSTLSRLLLGLEEPSEGDVFFHGEKVSGRREKEIRDFRRRAQIVFQDPMSSLDPRMRIGEILSEPLKALRMYRGEQGSRVREMLESVGLHADIVHLYPHQFSGGQRQRIAIARALMSSPELLVADEPVSALDVSVRAQLLNLLMNLIRDFRLTLVFVSHDLAVVRHVCDRVVVLYRGNIVEDGPTDRIYDSPEHEYTRSLLSAVPRLITRTANVSSTGAYAEHTT